MKLYFTFLTLLIMFFAAPLSVYGQTSIPSPTSLKDNIKQQRQDFRQKVKEERMDLKDKLQNLKDQFQSKLQNLKNKIAKIIGGEISAVAGNTLTVTKDGKNYTVNTDSNTHFQRHYWGKSSPDEFSVGNKVNVHGRFTDDTQTTILARMIRNLSIMKRHGVFFGDVTAKNSDNFTMNSKQRGDQAVYFDANTKFVMRNEQSTTYADVQIGHRVRVKGLWDKTLNKITEVIQVKNFSLPPQPTKVTSPAP